VGSILQRELARMKQEFPQIGAVAGKGLVAGVHCVVPETTEPDGALAWNVVERAIEKGVLLFGPVGPGGATVKICPPLVITEAALEDSLGAFREAFEEAVAPLRGPEERNSRPAASVRS
jgi:4-aminobutyrate aminotransferase-like enzyme